MVSLARANLVHEWRRSLAIVSVLSLVGTLILVQTGLPFGNFRSFLGPLLESSADLFAQAENDFDDGSEQTAGRRGRLFRDITGGDFELESRHEGLFWMHPNVAKVERGSIFSGGSFVGISWPNNKTSFADPYIVDINKGSLKFPKTFDASVKEALSLPGAIILSSATARRHKIKIGDEVQINKQNVFVAGLVKNLWEAQQERVMISQQTAQLIRLQNYNGGDLYLIGLKDTSKLVETQNQLRNYLATKRIDVMTPEAVERQAVNDFLSRVGSGSAVFVAIFAVVIGFAVTTQAMHGAVLAQFDEFGALRALGVNRLDIGQSIAEQAFWLGVVGVPATLVLAFFIKFVCLNFGIYIHYPWQVLIGCSVLVLTIAVIAGLVSLSALYRIDPAELMR